MGGLCRYCLKRSSKAWPTVLMTLWARPSQHSRMWQAGGHLVTQHQCGLAAGTLYTGPPYPTHWASPLWLMGSLAT